MVLNDPVELDDGVLVLHVPQRHFLQPLFQFAAPVLLLLEARRRGA